MAARRTGGARYVQGRAMPCRYRPARRAEKASGRPLGQKVWREKAMEAMVKIRLFKDHGEYRDPVFAAVNGRTYLIQRGEEVEVPACVAEVLENSMRQQQAADALIRRVSGGGEA